MASYQEIGPRGPFLGVSDAVPQLNPFLLGTGWDVIITAPDIASNLTNLQIYQIALDGPVGSSVWMFRNRKKWNFISQGWLNYDDPQQPLPLGQTDELQFCWNFAATAGPYNRTNNIQPEVTLWIRQEIPSLGL